MYNYWQQHHIVKTLQMDWASVADAELYAMASRSLQDTGQFGECFPA